MPRNYRFQTYNPDRIFPGSLQRNSGWVCNFIGNSISYSRSMDFKSCALAALLAIYIKHDKQINLIMFIFFIFFLFLLKWIYLTNFYDKSACKDSKFWQNEITWHNKIGTIYSDSALSGNMYPIYSNVFLIDRYILPVTSWNVRYGYYLHQHRCVPDLHYYPGQAIRSPPDYNMLKVTSFY